MTLFTLIVVLILLTIGDFVAKAVAENDIASQIQSNGLPVKPSVTIEGFPFLTQVIARDLKQIDISASEIPVNAGPTTINITSIKASITGLHLNSSFNGGTANHATGTVFVSFADLAPGFGDLPGGFTLTQAGPNLVKLTAGIGPLSDTEEARITYSATKVSIQFVNSGGLLSGIFSSLAPFSFSLPAGVPTGLRITNASVTSQGLTATVAGNNVLLTQPKKS